MKKNPMNSEAYGVVGSSEVWQSLRTLRSELPNRIGNEVVADDSRKGTQEAADEHIERVVGSEVDAGGAYAHGQEEAERRQRGGKTGKRHRDGKGGGGVSRGK